ncbi:Smr domain-containing protein [Porphyridium purpureum]|uniref:Smr domain-containing protein n=1 Tax=Porphyridium purpureum TaxID=35688 RepID=A0A5J4YS53_PORPP|nr:Smr domain-containing protein [Porphyridium purpureum]|eukprot:POR7453..scf296_7
MVRATDGGSARRELNVPSKFYGKIIGKQAATLKDIEETSGANVTVPGRDSGSEVVVVSADPPDAQRKVDAAVRRIADITDLDFGLGKTKGELLREQAWATHDDELHKQAAAAIFEELNGAMNRGMYEMDLHSLLVHEALEFVEQRLDELAKKPNKGNELQIITGRGNHSADGQAKIRPAVVELLDARGLKHDDARDAGSVFVTLGDAVSGSGTGAPQVPEEPVEETSARTILGCVLDILFACFGKSDKRS